jgi:hypothetical protein
MINFAPKNMGSQAFNIIFSLIVSFFFLALAWIIKELAVINKKLDSTPTPTTNEEGRRLKLQALERLTLFAERNGLRSLVERISQPGMSASDLHHALTESIRTEFEYNQSQQIYVSPELWNALARLRDQNIYIIHQLTANLPPHATGMDLSRVILEYSQTPNAEMNIIVLTALQYEAKTILS